MVPRLTPVLYAIEFLLALMASLTLWSQAGGQYHLDLIDWYWKLGIPLVFAAALTRLTAVWTRPERTRRALAVWALSVLLLVGLAGIVTLYYHWNEPVDEEADQTTVTRLSWRAGASKR